MMGLRRGTVMVPGRGRQHGSLDLPIQLFSGDGTFAVKCWSVLYIVNVVHDCNLNVVINIPSNNCKLRLVFSELKLAHHRAATRVHTCGWRAYMHGRSPLGPERTSQEGSEVAPGVVELDWHVDESMSEARNEEVCKWLTGRCLVTNNKLDVVRTERLYPKDSPPYSRVHCDDDSTGCIDIPDLEDNTKTNGDGMCWHVGDGETGPRKGHGRADNVDSNGDIAMNMRIWAKRVHMKHGMLQYTPEMWWVGAKCGVSDSLVKSVQPTLISSGQPHSQNQAKRNTRKQPKLG